MLAPELWLEPLMIPYLELCDAIDRWRARMNGEPADAAAPVASAPVAASPDEGMTPQTIAPEHTNEIDIDSVDLVDG
jgi:hypothetical protein